MEHSFLAPGVELITQEYLAARRQVISRDDLTQDQHERLKKELVYEYRPRCTQEWKIAVAQMRADHDLLRTSSG